MSARLSSRCLRELNECALQLFGEALDRLAGPGRLRPYAAAERATRLAGRVLAPLYARLDLVRLGEIGVADRAPDEAEAPLLDEVADALLECGEEVRVCGVFSPEQSAGREAATPALPGRPVERAAQAVVERAA